MQDLLWPVPIHKIEQSFLDLAGFEPGPSEQNRSREASTSLAEKFSSQLLPHSQYLIHINLDQDT